MKNSSGLQIYKNSFYQDANEQHYMVENATPDRNGKVEVRKTDHMLDFWSSDPIIKIDPDKLVKSVDPEGE